MLNQFANPRYIKNKEVSLCSSKMNARIMDQASKRSKTLNKSVVESSF